MRYVQLVLLVLETAAGLVSVATGWVKKNPANLLTRILPQGEEGGGKGNHTGIGCRHNIGRQAALMATHVMFAKAQFWLSALHPLLLLIFKAILGWYKDTLKVRLSSGDYFFR